MEMVTEEIECASTNDSLLSSAELESREHPCIIDDTPVTSNRFEWKNLKYSIKMDGFRLKSLLERNIGSTNKVILNQQSGNIKSGEITALMGPSGVGKTTLLNIITGNCNPDCVSGSLKFIAHDGRDMPKISYVPQAHPLQQDFSLRETFLFAFKFQLISMGMNLTKRVIESRIEALATDLAIFDALDTKVSLCSGGEIKRACVAVELISEPDILIIDEPTTGLDSMTAIKMMSLFQRMLKAGTDRCNYRHIHTPPAILCSIHQPSSELFHMFDLVYVLGNGGYNIFSGRPSDVPRFLSMNDIAINNNGNPADYLLTLSHRSSKITPIKTEQVEENEGNDQFARLLPYAKNGRKMSSTTCFIPTLLVLLQRQVSMLKHNPRPVIGRFLFCIFSTILLRVMYNHSIGSHSGCFSEIYNLNHKDTSPEPIAYRLLSSNIERLYFESFERMKQVLDNVGYFLISATFVKIAHAFMSLAEVQKEIEIVEKEVSNDWYSINAHLTAKLTVVFLTTIVLMSIYILFMIAISDQLIDIQEIVLLILCWILHASMAEMTGLIVGVLCSRQSVIAALILVSVIFPHVLFAGFIIKPSSIPRMIGKLAYLSEARHLFHASMVIFYGRGRCEPVNHNQLTFPEYLSITPLNMIGHIIQENNITHEISNILSPYLGLPDDVCIAQVINATRDYFALQTDGGISDYEDDTEDIVPTRENLSFALSMFEVDERNVSINYASLFLLFSIYVMICYKSFQRNFRRNF